MLQDSGKNAGNISIVFCDDTFLLNLNKQHLKHDYFTDILTFDLSEPGSQLVDAEVYISTDRVFENAKLFKTPYLNELHRVMFHGILHLTGFSDSKSALKNQMTTQENFYLENYFRVSR
jgi:rRNA maturation RNase YbeY